MFLSRILDSHKKPLGIFFKDGDGEGDGNGGGGGQDDDWKEQLPDEIKTNASILDIPDVATLAKRFIDTKAMVGNSFRVPGEDAGKEDWITFHENLMTKVPSLMFKPDASDKEAMEKVYDQLGRPEKDDVYKIPEIDGQGTPLDMSLAEDFRGIAHKLGLNQIQFEGVIKGLTEVSITKALDVQAQSDADVAALTTEWGNAYDQNRKKVTNFLIATKAPKPLQEMLAGAKVPSELTKYFLSLTGLAKGEGTNLIDDHGADDILTPEDAKLQMAEMRRNRDHPLNNPSDPANAAALVKYKKLAKSAFPEARGAAA